MVNHLLTTTIKVNIAPTAESQSIQRGLRNEKDKNRARLLELASGLGLGINRQQRLTAA
jgi:hypothetical protein